MSVSANWAVQKSLFELLRDDVELSGLLGGSRIYDHVPQRAAYPFVTIGDSISRDWSMSLSRGLEHVLTLHIWSKAKGKKQTYQIMEVVRELLHDKELSLVDHELVNLRHIFSDARLDRDGKSFHGVMRFRAVTELNQ